MATPPNTFSGHLEKWLLDNTKDSIFFINIVPSQDDSEEIETLMDSADHASAAERAAFLNGNGHTSTGFVVQERPDHLKILTCAHPIKHVFSAVQPLSRTKANRLFRTYVLCDHNESSFCQPGQNIQPERLHAQGVISRISCRDDLMLIRVRRADLMNLNQTCMRSHPPLKFSRTLPVAFDECVMISWPPLRPRTCVKGRVSHTSRSFNDLAVANPVGYRIDFMEVEIASELGSSGAPLVNGDGHVIAMLHGGYGTSFSFFVRLNDIIHFLTHPDQD